MSVHAEDSGTTTDIKHNLVLKEVCILIDGISVGSCADFVFLGFVSYSFSLVPFMRCTYQHLLVDAVVVVATRISRRSQSEFTMLTL